MGIEIERKFLIDREAWTAPAAGTLMIQGYLHSTGGPTVRVRLAGEHAWLTIKSRTIGVTRSEFEYPIPPQDAEQLLNLCQQEPIEKVRYLVPFEGHTWEVDVFSRLNQGLIVAEIELQHEDETFARPPWLGEEVSSDLRYANSNLAKRPFTSW